MGVAQLSRVKDELRSRLPRCSPHSRSLHINQASDCAGHSTTSRAQLCSYQYGTATALPQHSTARHGMAQHGTTAGQGRTEQSRAEQRRAEQSRAEQSRAEQSTAKHNTAQHGSPAQPSTAQQQHSTTPQQWLAWGQALQTWASYLPLLWLQLESCARRPWHPRPPLQRPAR